MDIQESRYYVNKTYRFLLPTLRGHGELFIKKFNPLFKLAVGVHDTLLDGSSESLKRNMYILFNKRVKTQLFYSFLEWVRTESYYVADYCPDSEFKDSKKHMIVVELPKRFHYSYDMFLKGKYSQMFSREEIDILFSKSKDPDRLILLRDESQKTNLINKINKEFDIKTSNINNIQEYDLPLKKTEEIFNCNSEDYSTYFGGETIAVWKHKNKMICQ